MRLELRKVKINKAMSDETTCFSADVFADGVRVGVASNRGCGGPNEFREVVPGAAARIAAYCKTLPPPYPGDPALGHLSMDVDTLIGKLVDDHTEAEFVKRHCRKKTLFRLVDTPPGEYRTVNKPYSPAVKDYLTRTYGDKLARVYNEPA